MSTSSSRVATGNALAGAFSNLYSLRGGGPLLVIAHRGASAQFAENSLHAINHCAAVGAHAVEVDVRRTKDGQFVIFHDADLKRIDGTKVSLEELSVVELNQRLVEANRPPVLTLSQLKHEYNRQLPIVFDLKLRQLPNALTDVLAKLPFPFFLGIRHLSGLAKVNTRWDRTRIVALVPEPATIERFVRSGAGIIRLWENWVTPKLVLKVRKLDAQVWVMMGQSGSAGNTDKKSLARILDSGVDGVLLNDPEMALSFLNDIPTAEVDT